MKLLIILFIIFQISRPWSFVGQTLISYVDNLDRNSPFIVPINFPINFTFNLLQIPILELYEAKVISAQLNSPSDGFNLSFDNDTLSIMIAHSELVIDGSLRYMLLGAKPTIPLHVQLEDLHLHLKMPNSTHCSVEIPYISISIGFKLLGGVISRIAKEPLRHFLINNLCPEISTALSFPVDLIFAQFEQSLNGRSATSLKELKLLIEELDEKTQLYK